MNRPIDASLALASKTYANGKALVIIATAYVVEGDAARTKRAPSS